ncbi:hypothetical protein Y032_0557g3404 [Ancylostoma ceylanicum]|uniref:Uncharacterized protein n=1 Tax=Ancylostoma ceylanicum TaxID=53326 RepID=A0A016WQA8_9BILA|nr:hypothetical protein Y032_0557g3404 [Ancylostoma ceylanicum]
MTESPRLVQHQSVNGVKDNPVPHLSMGVYCEQLRNWVNELSCWQAFHQYNSVVMAYQNQMGFFQSENNIVGGGFRRRRAGPVTKAFFY